MLRVIHGHGMNKLAVLGVVALVICYSTIAVSLTEDDWWRDNWKRQFVGRPEHVAAVDWDMENRPQSSLVVATNKGVLAALNPIDASIKWRRVLPEEESVSALIRHRKCTLTHS